MGTLGYRKLKFSAEFCQHLDLFPQSLFLCPSLLFLLFLLLVSVPFLLVVSPFLCHVFYFCSLCWLGCEFIFFLSFLPEVTVRRLSKLVFRLFVVVKNKPEMNSPVVRVMPTLLGGSWQVSDAFGYNFIVPAPWHRCIVTLATVGQRCDICLVSGCRLLMLDSMDISFFLLLNSANKNFCTQEGNKPFILHGNCMYSALYQSFFLNQHHKNCHSICST